MDEGIIFSVDRHPRLNESRGSAASVRADLHIYKVNEPAGPRPLMEQDQVLQRSHK